MDNMNNELDENKLARFWEKTGCLIIQVDGIFWYEYSGFMIPAYLPGNCPNITEKSAETVLKKTGKVFVRWDNDFNGITGGEWWYILKRGRWAVKDIPKQKKRWMIKTGRKNFTTRKMEFSEVLEKSPDVASAATKRYKGKSRIETVQEIERNIQAGKEIPGVLEYIGCFKGDKLVSYSENYIQKNAVWMVNIRHDPDYLSDYSSYALMDGILEYYLNQRQCEYILDGNRSIHHRTNFQEHLISVFGFSKEYANLRVLYSPRFRMCVESIYPCRNVIWAIQKKIVNGFIDNLSAILLQEYIRRSCMERVL